MREVRSIVPDEDLQPDNLTVTLKDPSQPVAQRRTDDLFISASPRSIGWHHDGGYARVAVTVYGSGTAVTSEDVSGQGYSGAQPTLDGVSADPGKFSSSPLTAGRRQPAFP